MTSISLWLESLNHVAVKGTLVLGLALMAGLGLRRVSAARRYPLWMMAVLSTLALPVAVFFLPAWQVLPTMMRSGEFPQNRAATNRVPQPRQKVTVLPREGGDSKANTPIQVELETTVVSPAPAMPFSWVQLQPLVGMVWLGVFGILMARTGYGAWRLRTLAAKCQARSEGEAASVSSMMAKIAMELGIQRQPRLLLGEKDAVPMVWGVFRPHLLLPVGAAEWPADKLRAVLLHELAHLKRRDPLALWAGQIMLAVHWFNPLAWLTLGRMRADQEQACDDTVLRHGIRASDYAQHLLDLSRHAKMGTGLSLCALAMARPGPVEGRVEAVLDGGKDREAAAPGWSMLWAGLALVTALPLAMLQAAPGEPMDEGQDVSNWTPLMPQEKWPMKLSPEDERRWRALKVGGDLAELPQTARDVESGLAGTGFPRAMRVSFTAPKESVRAG